MDKRVLSIIVAIYKVEDYLNQCVNSILDQTYHNLEVILVDDGSPDGCGAICDEYAKQDQRVIVHHQPNMGLCNALNIGLKLVTGDYITFVDGDDYIANKDAFRILMRKAVRLGADITVGNYHKDINGKLVPAISHGFNHYTDTTNVDFRFKGFYSRGHLAYTWGKIYKKSFLNSNNIFFKQYSYVLDKLFNIECLLKRPQYAFVKDDVYSYRYNINSVSHTYKKDFSKIWIGLSDDIYRLLLKLQSLKQFIDIIALHLMFAIFFCCKQEYYYSGGKLKSIRNEIVKFMDYRLTYKTLSAFLKNRYISKISSIKWRLMLYIFVVCIKCKLIGFLSLLIKLIIDFNIDGSLSSTGKVK